MLIYLSNLPVFLKKFMEKPIYRAINSLLNLWIAVIAIWAIYVSIQAFLGVTIYFPFITADAEPVPYYRLQSVRIAVFITVAYFSVLHLFREDREYPAIYFLEVYLKILTTVAFFLFYRAGVQSSEYFVLFFFGCYSLLMHFARRKNYKYFSKR